VSEDPAGIGLSSEEAEAVPAESVRLQWKSTVLAPIQIVRIYIHTLNDETKSNIYNGKNFWDVPLGI